MTTRFICPHCHNPIDPLALEVADSASAQYRICPECDEPIVVSVIREEPEEALPPPAIAGLSTVRNTESCFR